MSDERDALFSVFGIPPQYLCPPVATARTCRTCRDCNAPLPADHPRIVCDACTPACECAGQDCTLRHLCDECRVPVDATDCCPRCGVHHGDPCPSCLRRGYHVDGCERSDGGAA